MSTAAGLETLHYNFTGTRPVADFTPVLVGVVGSGNLEVLMEAIEGSKCRFEVQTSARGFGHIWEAVLSDFHASHSMAGVAIAIHDMGATPAVVALRLAQAAAAV